MMIGIMANNNFDPKNYSKEIKKIKAGNNIEKERAFKIIAKDLLKIEGFRDVIEGPSTSEIVGVPFDLIANKNGYILLVELKGSMRSFNFPNSGQYLRLFHLVNELKKRKIKHNIFLLQINIERSNYRIRDSQFFYEMPFKKIAERHIIDNFKDIVGFIKNYRKRIYTVC